MEPVSAGSIFGNDDLGRGTSTATTRAEVVRDSANHRRHSHPHADDRSHHAKSSLIVRLPFLVISEIGFMKHEQPLNRMSDKPDLEPLRGSSSAPSLWQRRSARIFVTLFTRTGVTVMLAIAIGIALIVATWVIV